MLVYKKYEILNLDFVGESKLPILDSKYKYISDFMFRQIQGKFVFLFEMNPHKDICSLRYRHRVCISYYQLEKGNLYQQYKFKQRNHIENSRR